MSNTTLYTPAQQHVLKVLRSGRSLSAKRNAQGGYTDLILEPQYFGEEEIYAVTIYSLLRHKAIMVSQELSLGSGRVQVFFRCAEPWDRIQWIIDDLEEKLCHSSQDEAEKSVTLIAMVGIIEELIANLEDRIRKPVQTQIQRFLDLVRERQREDSSEAQNREESEVGEESRPENE